MKTIRAPWGTVDGVGPVGRFRISTTASCRFCPWGRSIGSRKAVQSATRRHVARTGHVAQVTSTDLVEYGREDS